MHSKSIRIAHTFIMIFLVTLLFGCSSAKQTTNPNLTWSVGISKSEIKDKLEGVVTVAQYESSSDEYHQQLPDEGNVYVLLNLTINKQGAGTIGFDWEHLTLQDASGIAYQRLSNDSFLETYKYTPRMTGLALQIGKHEGWVCFEIPKQAAEGKLTLVYTGEGSQQEISINK